MAAFEPYFGDGEDEIGLCGGNRSLLEEGIMAACALNDAILDTRTGLDTFFLIFAVRFSKRPLATCILDGINSTS